jgi:imidazolonepropionase-like amidohydrolase
MPHLSDGEKAAGVRVAHSSGKRVAAHAVSREGVRRSLDAGADSIEHGYDLTDELVEMMRTRNSWLVPTLSVHGAIVQNGASAGWSADRIRNSERVLATAVASVRRAFRAGVNIACGSDAGSPFNAVWEIVPELRLLCEAGLTPGEALQAATRRAAELIGAEREIGTLEAGKRADVVLVDGDPLLDVEVLRRIHGVVKDGIVVRAPGGE